MVKLLELILECIAALALFPIVLLLHKAEKAREKTKKKEEQAKIERERKAPLEQAARKRWIEEHTDPMFGILTAEPPGWWDGESHGEAPKIDRLWVFSVTLINKPIRLTTNPFPCTKQRETLLWIKNNIEAISRLVPSLLLQSSKDNLGQGCCFYGVPTPEQASNDFHPDIITAISLSGTDPVKWAIGYYSSVDQDVYGSIEGEDEIVKNATLWM